MSGYSRVVVESILDDLMEEVGERHAGQLQSLVHLALQVGRFEGIAEAQSGRECPTRIPWLAEPVRKKKKKGR